MSSSGLCCPRVGGAGHQLSLFSMGDVSLGSPGDGWASLAANVSPGAVVDVSPGDDRDPRCLWCRELLGATALAKGALYCSKRCRQTAWRSRKVTELERAARQLRVAYADPPYPGTARKYYSDQPNYAGEVDHARLLSLLQDFDGWALSTSQKALPYVLRLISANLPVRIAPWVKPIGCSRMTRGPHNTWEAVVYVPARLVRPGVRDWLSTHPARGGGTLSGRKPLAFCRWLLVQLLGMRPGDQLADLFPGTGVVSNVWAQLSRKAGVELFPILPNPWPPSPHPGVDGAARGEAGG